MTDQNTTDSPVISLPQDEELRNRLLLKLTEYRERLEPFRAPELQLGTFFKIKVLERLLENGEVNTYDLSLELANHIGKRSFSTEDYNNACGVINDYVTTGGANVQGGTGLPSV